jgi:hypothetical protein
VAKFGKRVDGVDGHRVAAREPVLLPVWISTISTSRTVEIVNISRSGAKLHGDNLPETGTDLLVRVGPVDVLATVVWHHDEACGVTFDRPVSDADVAQLRRETRWANVTQLTSEERLAAQDWLSGFAR